MARKISVRLNDELLVKIKNWTSKSISLSDTVRQALILLPNSPEEISILKHAIKPLPRTGTSIKSRNETEALQILQDW